MDGWRRQVLLLRSAPGTSETASALHLANILRGRGHAVTLALIQDAVLCVLDASGLESARHLRALVADGVRCTYLAEDLSMRGYGAGDVSVGCEPIGYDDLVDLLLVDGTTVVGAF